MGDCKHIYGQALRCIRCMKMHPVDRNMILGLTLAPVIFWFLEKI